MKKKGHDFQGTHFGGITVVNILFILCLCCLSLSAFSQAAADSRLTQKNACTVKAYYRAEEKTAVIVQKIEDLCKGEELPETIADAGAELASAARLQGASHASFDAKKRELTLSVDAGNQGRYEAVFYLREKGSGFAIEKISAHIVPESEINYDFIPVF